MLAIRMQRTGRKGHAMFRVVVQDARLTPSSGKVVARLGSYDPHTKTVNLTKDKASFYLEHGAQPSDRVAKLLQGEGIVLPAWVKSQANKSRGIRNPEKLRRNRPAEPEVAEPTSPEATAKATAEQATESTVAADAEDTTKAAE